MKAKNKKIVYGDSDITEDLKHEPMLRTTMFLDLSLIEQLKFEAGKKKTKYQQLIREILNNHFNQEEDLEKRIKLLEKEVFNKKRA